MAEQSQLEYRLGGEAGAVQTQKDRFGSAVGRGDKDWI
jgi:hypothetical protein